MTSYLPLVTDEFDVVLSLQIASGVIIAWTRTIWDEFTLLAGKSASHEFIQLITYKAATFSDKIEKVDTVRAYHVRCPNLLLLLEPC